MIVAYVVAPLLVLVIAVGGVRVGIPAWHGWQHDRCLARIDVLERDLGIEPSRSLTTRSADDVSMRWVSGVNGGYETRWVSGVNGGYETYRRRSATLDTEQVRNPGTPQIRADLKRARKR